MYRHNRSNFGRSSALADTPACSENPATLPTPPCLALIVLVMHFNFRIYRFIAVRYLIYALVPMYSLLIAHEINMLANL